MSERSSSRSVDAPDPELGDPDRGSTWNTIDGTAEVDELLNDDDLENFLVEPIPDPLANPVITENT